jgi:hypothetical protein
LWPPGCRSDHRGSLALEANWHELGPAGVMNDPRAGDNLDARGPRSGIPGETAQGRPSERLEADDEVGERTREHQHRPAPDDPCRSVPGRHYRWIVFVQLLPPRG